MSERLFAGGLAGAAIGAERPYPQSSWVLYVESPFGIKNPTAWTNFGIAMLGLWIPAAINLFGARQMAWFQNLTSTVTALTK